MELNGVQKTRQPLTQDGVELMVVKDGFDMHLLGPSWSGSESNWKESFSSNFYMSLDLGK